jgi:hypothetical protein
MRETTPLIIERRRLWPGVLGTFVPPRRGRPARIVIAPGQRGEEEARSLAHERVHAAQYEREPRVFRLAGSIPLIAAVVVAAAAVARATGSAFLWSLPALLLLKSCLYEAEATAASRDWGRLVVKMTATWAMLLLAAWTSISSV